MNISFGKLAVAGLFLLLITSIDCSAQNVSNFFQGSFGSVRNRIATYETGGIWQQDYISPYLRNLRGNTPSPYTYRNIRPQQDRRQNRLDNRDQRRIDAYRLSRGYTGFNGTSPSYQTTGHTTKFMTYRSR